MGCVQCKICHQEEEKNQFEYPSSVPSKEDNNITNREYMDLKFISNTNPDSNQSLNNNFIKEFDEKLQSMGKYIPEEEFHKILNDINNNLYKPNDPFPFESMNPSPHKMKPIEFEQGNIYEGEWNENFEMDGYGKYLLKEENVLAEGIWEKGELKRGRIFYPNGEFYEGEILNSSYNGKGKLINENNDIFTGEFLDGEKVGEGTIIFSDGAIYKGNFMQNQFYGYGELTLNNGIRYKGNFVQNMLDGKGIMNLGEEEKYDGFFKNNLFHGKGIYTYSNGDEYDGDFEYDIRKGKGIYRQNNGLTFQGSWENNVPNGFGKINFNEKIIKCNYHNGKIIDRPVDEDGVYHNNIDYNFYCEKMNLSGIKLTHLDNNEEKNDIFNARTDLSFFDDE